MSDLASLKHKKGANLVFVISDESRNALLEICPPNFGKVSCRAVTIISDVSAGQLQKYKDSHDAEPEVYVTGYATDEKIECFTVTVADESRRRFGDGGLYHAVLSVEPPAKAADASKLLKDPDAHRVVFESPIKIDGTFELKNA